MSGHSSYEPSTGLEKWVDARLPLPRMVYDSFIAYPVPRNLNYAYTFGAMLAVMLIVQILTGVTLAMHYAADTTIASKGANSGQPLLPSATEIAALEYPRRESVFWAREARLG